MRHRTMLKYSDNDKGFIQCVIRDDVKSDFESLGFVDHIDKVKKPVKRKKAVKNDN